MWIVVCVILCGVVHSAGVAVRNYNARYSDNCEPIRETSYQYYEYDVCYDGNWMYRQSTSTGLVEVWQGSVPSCSNSNKDRDETLGECDNGNSKMEGVDSFPKPAREAQVVTRYSSNECDSDSVLFVDVAYTTCGDADEYSCQDAGAGTWASLDCSKVSLSAAETKATTLVGANVYVGVAVSVMIVIGIIVTILIILVLCAVKSK